ncbi:MAG: oligosaccharide flippase family protein [Bacteroidota bacterium]
MKAPLKNMIAVLAGDVGSRAISFLVTVYLARILAPSAFGLINIGLGVLGYLTLLNSPGIQVLEARNAAATPGGMMPRVGAILSMRLFLVPLLLIMTAAVLALTGTPAETRNVVLIYAVSLIPMAMSLDWLFQGKEDFRLITVSRLLNALLYAIVAVLLVRSAADVRLTGVAFLVGNWAAVAYMGVKYRSRFGVPPLRWDPAAWGGIMRENIPVGAAMFLTQSVTNLPPIAIAMIMSNADVGIYSAAMKLVFVVLIMDRTLNALFLPIATRYATWKPGEYPVLLSVMLKTMVVILFPLTIAAIMLAEPAVGLVFGSGYEEAVPLFRMLMAYVVVTMLNSLFVCTLMAFARTTDYAIVVGGGALLICVGVFAFTWLLGTPGAAIGIAVGETVILLFLIRKSMVVTDIPSWTTLLKPVVATAVMALTGWALMNQTRFIGWGLIYQTPIIALCISAVIYILALTLMGGIPREEFRYLKERLA